MEIRCLKALPGIFFLWVTTEHMAVVFGNALPPNIPCCSLSCCCSTWVVVMQKSGLVLLFLNVPKFSNVTRPCFHPRSFSSKRQLIFLFLKCILMHLIFPVEPHLRILKCFEAIRNTVFSTAKYDMHYDSRIFQNLWSGYGERCLLWFLVMVITRWNPGFPLLWHRVGVVFLTC